MRKSENAEILALLVDYLDRLPDIRFGQALRNLGIVLEVEDDAGVRWKDGFSEESQEVLRRMKALALRASLAGSAGFFLGFASLPGVEAGSGASDDRINQAEFRLQTRFPDSLRRFFAEVGWLQFGSFEIFGLDDSPSHLLDVIENTLSERTDVHPPIPAHLVPLMADGSGSHHCIDTTTGRIVYFDHEREPSQPPQELSETLEAWLVDLLSY